MPLCVEFLCSVLTPYFTTLQVWMPPSPPCSDTTELYAPIDGTFWYEPGLMTEDRLPPVAPMIPALDSLLLNRSWQQQQQGQQHKQQQRYAATSSGTAASASNSASSRTAVTPAVAASALRKQQRKDIAALLPPDGARYVLLCNEIMMLYTIY